MTSVKYPMKFWSGYSSNGYNSYIHGHLCVHICTYSPYVHYYDDKSGIILATLEAGKSLLGRRKNPAADYPKAENKTQGGISAGQVGPKEATPEDQLGWKICSASNDASATAESKPLGQELYLHGGREPKPTKKHKAHLQKRATKIITSDELAKCQGGQHIVQDVTQEKKSSCTNRLATHSSY